MGTLNGLISRALAEVGYLEKKNGNTNYLYDKTANAGSANYTKYGKEMHDIYPSVMDYPAYWCDAFVDWLFYKEFGIANAKGLLGGNFDDYTVASAQLYKNKGAWYTKNPKVGDQVFFKNDSRINHTGLVVAVTSSTITTVEGNTSGASTVVANGGGVCKKSYAISYSRIAGYGRPNYARYAAPEYSVTELQTNLNTLGYDCGTVDGIFGTKTENAVKAFQKANGLTVDGIVGTATLSKISEKLAEHKALEAEKEVLRKAEEKYRTAYDWAYKKGITTNDTLSGFNPTRNCTRAEAVTFLWRLSGTLEPVIGNLPFSDVTEGDYFYKAVLWSYEQGITNGYSDGCFKPSKAVSRGDFVAFLWRSVGRPEAGGACDFVDIEAERYYYEAVLWAIEKGITKGKTDKMFAPGLPCNRGEAVTFLCRI